MKHLHTHSNHNKQTNLVRICALSKISSGATIKKTEFGDFYFDNHLKEDAASASHIVRVPERQLAGEESFSYLQVNPLHKCSSVYVTF